MVALPLRATPRRASKRQRRAITSANITEMVDAWKKTGRIGTSKPKAKKKAVAQAVAAALSEQDRSRKKARPHGRRA